MSQSIRYIRDTANGSNAAASSYWMTLAAYGPGNTMLSGAATYSTTGVVISGTVTADVLSDTTSDGVEISVDGVNTTVGAVSVTCDLGSIMVVDYVRLLRYPGFYFYESKTEVSADGVAWTVLRDAAVSGTYTEPAFPGVNITLPAPMVRQSLFLNF